MPKFNVEIVPEGQMVAYAHEAPHRPAVCFAKIPPGIAISQKHLGAIFRAYTAVRTCLMVPDMPPLEQDMVQTVLDGEFPDASDPDAVMGMLRNFKPSAN